MPISKYLRDLRSKIGTSLVLMPGVAAVIRNNSGEILLQRRSDTGTWGLPAGAVDPGETPAQAIVREVREETGLSVIPRQILAVFGGEIFRVTYPNGDQVEYTTVLFNCVSVGGGLEPSDDETLELKYFPLSELPDVAMVFPLKDILGRQSNHAVFQWEDSLQD